MVYASLPLADFAYVQGEALVKRLTLVHFAERAFCGQCGSPLTIAYDFQADTIDFTVCSLDDPGAVPPEHHIFWSSRPCWLESGDDLSKHARFRPGTLGLEGTEPPA
jgi:hypothetical protein